MKILLAYSKAHFDPEADQSVHKYSGGSANVLASTLYQSLAQLGETTYIDSWAPEDRSAITGKHFDLFVGTIDKFAEINHCITATKKILFAVNSHPRFRNQQLRDFMTSAGISKAALSSWDEVDDSHTLAVTLADYIIGVGDNVVYNSYIENGVDKQTVKMINYGVGKPLPTSKAKSNRLVYVASDIGVRKGFDIICSIFSDPKLKDKDFHLDIVGPLATDHHKKKMEQLLKKLGDKVTHHGWLDAHSTTYKKILSEAAFLVFPSLEEGQAGTVLDGLRQAIIPISSPNTGVPFSPLGQLELSTKSKHNVDLICEAIATSSQKLKALRQHAERYYQEFHANFQVNLQETLSNIIQFDNLYPKVSLVLPIFNKESTIESLLEQLDRSCAAYNNVELQIIFDGCKDKTQKIVRAFYRKRPETAVTYYTTPNIFEVKTNNIGLKNSSGKYSAIIQDDNFIYDRSFLFETAMLLDNNPRIAILGGLAGVNFYPRGTKGLKGSGQIALNDNEAYWRQDEVTNPDFKYRYYEVDACMRGPLIFRKSFLEEHGYLDEAYAPFYMDDMDICFRAKQKGYHVYTALFNVENKSLTVATYDTAERKQFWADAMKRSADIFYKRWAPSVDKDYDWIHRVPLSESLGDIQREQAFQHRYQLEMKRRERNLQRRLRIIKPVSKTKRGVYGIARRIKRKISS